MLIITLCTPRERAPTSAKNLDTSVPELVVLKKDKSHLSNVSVHKLLYKDTYQFQKNIR